MPRQMMTPLTQQMLPPKEFSVLKYTAGERPTVAVVMPAFNAARTILPATRSVLNQSYGNVHLVVCDDASTDGTADLLGSITDSRLTVLINGSNLGPGLTRDRAIAATSAPWIAVIDADDLWDPSRLERLMAANSGAADTMIFDDLLLCHDTPSGLAPWRTLRGNNAFGSRSKQSRMVSLEKFITAPRLLIKPVFPGDLVRDHALRHSDRRFGEDIEYFMRLAALGVRLRYVPEPLYHYRITPGSATATAGARSAMRDSIEACSKFDGFSESARQAFEFKIKSLADNEDLYLFASQIRSRHLLRALATLIRKPRLFLLLPQRILRVLGYEAHRILRSGSRRKLS